MQLKVLIIGVSINAIMGGIIAPNALESFGEPQNDVSSDRLVDYITELNSNVDYKNIKVDRTEEDDKRDQLAKILKPEILKSVLLGKGKVNPLEIGITWSAYNKITSVTLPTAKFAFVTSVKNYLKDHRRNFGKGTKGKRAFIDVLAEIQKGDIEAKIIAQIVALSGKNKYYLEDAPIIITYLKDLFEGDLLKEYKDFFAECNSYNPELASRLKRILKKVQTTYAIFPSDYYRKLESAHK